MTIDEEDALMENIERWDAREAKRAFIHRMERKLGRKQRYQRR